MNSNAAILHHLDTYHQAMIAHIEFYTVGQYKDWPEDEATFYTVADCLWQIRKYLRRYGENRRPGQDRLDMLKLGHYAAIAAAKVYDQDLDQTGRTPGMSYRAHEWCVVYSWLSQMITNGELADAGWAFYVESTPDFLAGKIEEIMGKMQKKTNGVTIPSLLEIIYFAAVMWLKTPDKKTGDTVPFVRVKKMHSAACLPEIKTAGAAGADLCAVERYTVPAGRQALIRTGIAVEIPEGYEGQIRSRSGISAKKQLILLNGVGTIDSDYRGEIMVPLQNIGRHVQSIRPGDRIAQLMVKPATQCSFCWADELGITERGAGSFGSTGVN